MFQTIKYKHSYIHISTIDNVETIKVAFKKNERDFTYYYEQVIVKSLHAAKCYITKRMNEG
jgi:hypothetical protein